MSSDPSQAKKSLEQKVPRSLYLRQVISNFGGGLMNPYVSIYAIQLGAGPSEMGWLRSLNNLFSNLQVPWGAASDRLGRYVPFIVLGGIASALLWLPMLYATTPWQLILIVAMQAAANSMVAPAWAALLGRILPESTRASGTANVNAAASLGAISATLLSGVLVMEVSGSPAERYRIPLLLAAVCGFSASLAMCTMRESRVGERPVRKLLDWKSLRDNRNFRVFVLINTVHSFFMSMAWPLFPMTIAQIVGPNLIQVAYLSAISGSVSLVMRRYAGRLSDRAGRKPLILLGRAGVVVYPLMYAFASSIYHLYVADFTIGIISAIADIAVFAYLLDITELGQRGALVAVYNTLAGFSTFFGSILGGYLVVFFGSLGLDFGASLRAAYIVSASGRLGAGLLFLKISEQNVYPSTVRRELVSIMTEDAERTRYMVGQVDKLGEKADSDFRADMDRFGNRPEKKEKASKETPSKNAK